MSKTIERRTGVISIEERKENQEEIKVSGNITEELLEKYFHLAKLSSLSVNDEFLKHEPETTNQAIFKDRLLRSINYGNSDIIAARMDPSFDEYGNICFSKGKLPAVGESQMWWYERAKMFMPERGSRLGTYLERTAFLGLLIKKTLIAEQGYTVSDAWKAVCDNSKELGYFRTEEEHNFEPTGSRQVGEWYDLGNTSKIINCEPSGELHYGVHYSCEILKFYGGLYEDDYGRYKGSLAQLGRTFSFDVPCYRHTGWIVLSN